MPHGAPFVVYPGENGPIDSIGWEVFAESLQDYALLQTANIDPDDPMLAELKSYALSQKAKLGSKQRLLKCFRERLSDSHLPQNQVSLPIWTYLTR